MRVIKGRRVVDDAWQLADKVESLPPGDVIVPLEQWHRERASLLARGGRLGVLITADDDAAGIVADLDKFDLIALEFAKFTDGRPYSHARLLKERYAYRGELRAVGEVLRDQLFYMARCGFDSFAVKEGRDPEEAVDGLNDFSVVYQCACDHAAPAYRLRSRN